MMLSGAIYRKVLPATLGLLMAVACVSVAIACRGFSLSSDQRSRRVSDSGSPSKGVLKSGDDLNAAIRKAQPGDTIVLEAGAVFKGPITLPVKSGAEYIMIRSSALESDLPEGIRVTPAQSAAMPKIITAGKGEPAIKTEPGAHHFQFMGIEFKPSDSSAEVYDLVRLGDERQKQTKPEQVPHHLIFDRCYIHGDAAGTLKRGIALNSGHTDIVNSYISEIKIKGFDSQAISGWNGPGPFKIINNYLEGAGENVMFGGADPGIAGLVPSDIEIRRNHFFKPLSWRDKWTIKNLFELKNASRVVVDGNLFENNWADAQLGFAIAFSPRNQEDTAPWSVVRDVQFTNNVLRHIASGFNIMGTDNIHKSEVITGLLIHNNLLYDVTRAGWGGHGFGILLNGGGTEKIRITHNTMITDWVGLQFETSPVKIKNLEVLDNVMNIIGGGPNVGTAALDWGADVWNVRRNIIVGTYPQQPHPPDNLFPPVGKGFSDLGFVNADAGDYRFPARSVYKKPGTDGHDIGCDFDALKVAFAAANKS